MQDHAGTSAAGDHLFSAGLGVQGSPTAIICTTDLQTGFSLPVAGQSAWGTEHCPCGCHWEGEKQTLADMLITGPSLKHRML